MTMVVGDIGGTKTHLALAEMEKGFVRLSGQRRFVSRGYDGLAPILAEYLNDCDISPAAGAFAIAGPVIDDRCDATNLPWQVDARALELATGIASVRLLNDLEAIAWSVGGLTESQLQTLHPGDPSATGNAAVVAPGTGLGQAGLFWDGRRHHPFATEGGHHDFAPTDAREFALLEFLQGRYGHVSWERVVSGMGIENIHAFLLDAESGNPHPDLAAVIAQQGDIAAVVSALAAAGRCERCVRTMEWFALLLGREAGNVALKLMARGGVYIAGGIVPKNLDCVRQGIFLRGFLDKGRMQPLLESMPVRVILDQDAPLLGAAAFLNSRG